MKKQSSFLSDNNKCYLVATPIGNLSEMTPRAIEILNEVDLIACEDTRTSSVLLSYFNIKTKCISYHMHNELESANKLIDIIKTNKSIALISDAGYPLISDPGSVLVSKLIDEGIDVVPISGSSAFINALVASGILIQPFLFHGFLNGNDNDKIKVLDDYQKLAFTLVFYESPHRIKQTLNLMLQILGDRKICLAREITKKHEEFMRGNISEVIEECDNIKGEIVLIVDRVQEEIKVMDDEQVIFLLNELINSGIHSKEAIKRISKEYNLKKSDIYALYHNNK